MFDAEGLSDPLPPSRANVSSRNRCSGFVGPTNNLSHFFFTRRFKSPPPHPLRLPLHCRFDLNSGTVRDKFLHVFTRESPTGAPDDIATPSITVTGSSTRETAGASGGSAGGRGKGNRRRGTPVERNVTGCRRALFALDPKNADARLFLVLQLSKVLQGEPEKVRDETGEKGGGGG